MTKVSGLKQIREKTKRYVRENWGLPFILAFMLLLFIAALILAVFNWTSVAELIATGAYFVLVIGVVLQLIHFGKNNLHKGAVFNGSD